MDLKGKFNHKMIKKAHFGTTHFDEGMNFISVEKDKITGAVGPLQLMGSDADTRRTQLKPSF